MRVRHGNIRMVAQLARSLGPLREKVVFLGGAVAGLLITDPGAPGVRSTRDVDVIVEITSKSEYYKLAEVLRSLGFREDLADDAPLCRWRIGDLRVDVMPTAENVLGFSNDWYVAAFGSANLIEIESDLEIRVVAAPFFLATKVQAFLNRGQGDCYASPDMEDIIAVLDGRLEILAEIMESPNNLRAFLGDTFTEFLGNKSFLASLPGHLTPDSASQSRLPELKRRIEAIVRMAL